MYAIGTQPLIRRLDGIAKQVWYADDSAAGSSLEKLKRWWDLLKEICPLYCYFPNSSKTHVLAKSQHIEAAKEIFKRTGITVSPEGDHRLGKTLILRPSPATRDSNSITLHPGTHRAISPRQAGPRNASTTCKTWGPRPDESHC